MIYTNEPANVFYVLVSAARANLSDIANMGRQLDLKALLQAEPEYYGELAMENAIAVSRSPSKVITGDTYHLAGKDFKSKEEAIRYAVELAGGLTVTKMTTVAVEV
ncbi:hypothetical protein [Cronobacter phage Dev2]|uniref:Uncharacterized protein n=1 Tax=Cronobacter phage Dev2 TaxID=1410331 RepID=W6PW86_9CAUD|nr:SAM-dependent methyltransferase [Cronobacter phage Dev2]CDM12525.1 hypothetical protein [Cronobacter phage Dev2]